MTSPALLFETERHPLCHAERDEGEELRYRKQHDVVGELDLDLGLDRRPVGEHT